MAVLHLELEVDSDVYPELYLKLASLPRPSAREEKLRQLAAHGLVWEIARLHGPAVFDIAAPSAMPMRVEQVVDHAAEASAAPAAQAAGASWSPNAVDSNDEAAIPESVAAEFDPGIEVDLALDAFDAMPAAPSDAAVPPPLPPELPVLLDVVVEADPVPVAAAPRAPPRAPSPPSHRAARSSRIARMKQRGLFQNE